MSEAINLLLAEDSDDDARLVVRELKRGGFEARHERVESAAAMVAALQRQAWDVVISDYNMPGFSGMDALRILRSTGLVIPFILISGTVGEEIAVDALKAGAADYVLKKNLSRLPLVLKRELAEAAVRRAQRQSEVELRKLSLAVRQSGTGIVITDPVGAIEFVNPKFEAMTGYSASEVNGKNLRFLKSGLTPLETYRDLWETITAGKEWRGEIQNRRKSGDLYWEKQHISPVLSDDGAIRNFIAVKDDVTERKRAEAELRASEAGLRQAQQIARLGHAVTRSDGSFESWSETLPALIGMELFRFPKSTREWIEHLHPDDRAMFRDRSIEAGKSRARVDIEYRLRRGDGNWANFRHVMEPLQDPDEASGATRWFNTVQDVTEHKLAEAATRESEQRFRQLAENVQEVFYLTDREGKEILYVSPAYERVWGRTVEELYARPDAWRTAIHPDDQPAVRAVFEQGPSGLDSIYRIVRPDGTTRWVHDRGFPVLDDTGKLIRIAGIAEDITESRRAEQIRALEHAVARHLADAQSAADGLRAAMRLICESEGWQYSRYWRVDDAARVLRFADSWCVAGAEGEKLDAASRDVVFAPGTGLAGRVWQSGQPLWVSNVDDARAVLTNVARATGMRGAFVFPVTSKGTTIGALAFFSREIREPDKRLLAAVGVIGGQIGQFLQRKQGEEALRESERGVRRLNRVYAVMSGINTLIVRVPSREELFREACRIAVDHGKFHIAWIAAVKRDPDRVDLAAHYGGDRDFVKTLRNRDWLGADKDGHRPAIGRVLIEKKAVFSNDTRNDPRIRYTNDHMQHGRSIAVLPLIVADSVVAVLCLHAPEIGFFDEEEQKLLLELAGNISFALDHLEKGNRLDYLAFYDSLTGLANRALFGDRLNGLTRAAGQAGSGFAVAKLDMERMRTINESLGRQAGDELLKQVAQRLERAAGTAAVSRSAADHFAVVLNPVDDRAEAERRIQEISRACFEKPFQASGTELKLVAKIGIALFPDDGTDAETLVGNAEAALRKAKALGERHVFYTADLTERTARSLTLENKLRQALEKDEFVLHYQPKVDLETRRIVGVEALIRWQSPELGLVPPAKFIPLMEETGMILDVGAWALRRAAMDHRRWMEQHVQAQRVAVNVSAIQLRQRDFVRNVEQAIIEGVAPTGIDLEITESLIMGEIEGNIEKLKAVRGLGVKIAIDDFGTGYSSLGYLAKLPVQALKIDRSFIITMLGDPDAMTLVQTMISLARSLKLKVIAEGVDAEEQAKVLRLLRCDQMQGYLFSKPVPFDEMTALLKQERKGA